MTNALRRVLVFVMLALGLTAGACGGDGSVTGPTAETGTTRRSGMTCRPGMTYRSSGVVYDTAHRLLSRRQVEVIEGVVEGYWCHSPVRPTPVCIVTTVTDGAGRFSFSGGFESVTRLRASMAVLRSRDVDRRFHQSNSATRISSRAERHSAEFAAVMHLLLRPVDQDDVGVLLRAVEHDVFSVRRDVEAAQASLVGQLCELSLLAGDEIEQPEVRRLQGFAGTRDGSGRESGSRRG